jgi:hypothetical protein
MNINPLDTPGVPFEIELMNPNPSSSRKGYRISFQVSEEVHSAFMAAREGNLRLIGKLAVAPDTDEQDAHEAVNGKAKKKPKEKTPHGDMWRELFLAGFINCPGVREAVNELPKSGYEKPRDLLRQLFGVESLSREVGQYQIYERFPAGQFPQVEIMVEQAVRKVGVN